MKHSEKIKKKCPFCENYFIPNKYRPKQLICSNKECQNHRQLNTQMAWRIKNYSSKDRPNKHDVVNEFDKSISEKYKDLQTWGIIRE